VCYTKLSWLLSVFQMHIKSPHITSSSTYSPLQVLTNNAALTTCRQILLIDPQYPCLEWTRQEQSRANVPNRYSALCWRPVTHAQTWASYSALYRFGRLSQSSFFLLLPCLLSTSTTKTASKALVSISHYELRVNNYSFFSKSYS